MMLCAQLFKYLILNRSSAIAATMVALALTIATSWIRPQPLQAQERVLEDSMPDTSDVPDIESVRKQLSAASSITKAANESDDGFAVVDGDIEKANADLSLAEEKLLKQLQKTKDPAPAIAEDAMSSSSSSNIRIINDQFDKTDAAIKELNANISEQMASLKMGEKSQKAAAAASTKAIATSVALGKENAKLRQELATLQGRYSQASKDLEAARNRLMVAETEVERLSTIVQSRARSDMASVAGVPVPQKPRVVAPIARANDRIPRPDSVGPDMPVATVVAEKANLRIGPSLKDSPLMSVSQGTRLTVERRDGEWYRVIAPTGARAWVSSDVVQFGRAAPLSPDNTVRILGVKESRDSDNFTIVEKNGSTN